jgi:hypothetical protein
MQIPFVCDRCLTEGGRGVVYAIAEINEDGLFEAQCEHGHAVRAVSERPNHEWLISAGAYAIGDGYYREAVLDFAAALESAFGFYVEASLFQAKLEMEPIRELLRQNRQDQRRAGMVSLCYLRDTGRQFPYLHRKWVEFRNDTVHNGQWPIRAKAIEYAAHVCEAVLGLYEVLGPALEAVQNYRLGELVHKAGYKTMLDSSLTFLSCFERVRAIDQALQEFRKYGPHRTLTGPRLVK